MFGFRFLLAVVHSDGTDVTLRGRPITDGRVTVESCESNKIVV